MQLKLAEYNKEGKFERFLELGKDFGFFGDYIAISELKITFANGNTDDRWRKILRDEKDPLNRFGGLFDGRTYGNGRFVLIYDENCKPFGAVGRGNKKFYCDSSTDEVSEEIGTDSFDKFCPETIYKKLGNLHENPELWEKIR